jgi:sortase A
LNNDGIIENYSESVNTLSELDKQEYLSAAREYNRKLAEKVSNISFSTNAFIDGYDDILNFDGIIGYINIPVINVNLPIYHGSDESYLTKGAVHIPNTAFPVGGIGNNTVISAHTGYPTQVFFDNLPELEKGDLIYINVLDETLVYKVCDKNVVEPSDMSLLQADESRDMLSLMTCYPYGINSHRLIITAERQQQNNTSIEESPDTVETETDNSCYVAIGVVALCFIIFIVFLIFKIRKGRGKYA